VKYILQNNGVLQHVWSIPQWDTVYCSTWQTIQCRFASLPPGQWWWQFLHSCQFKTAYQIQVVILSGWNQDFSVGNQFSLMLCNDSWIEGNATANIFMRQSLKGGGVGAWKLSLFCSRTASLLRVVAAVTDNSASTYRLFWPGLAVWVVWDVIRFMKVPRVPHWVAVSRNVSQWVWIVIYDTIRSINIPSVWQWLVVCCSDLQRVSSSVRYDQPFECTSWC